MHTVRLLRVWIDKFYQSHNTVGMGFMKLVPLLAMAPLLSGCFTSQTLDAAKYKDYATLQIGHIEKATVTTNNCLLIFAEANVTNSSHIGQYTISIPLSAISRYTHNYPSETTNEITYGHWAISSPSVRKGWSAGPDANAVCLPVVVGQPIVMPVGKHLWDDITPYKLLPGADRSICQIINSDDYEKDTQFVYVDAKRPEAFAFFRVMPDAVCTGEHKDKYWLLIFAVPADVATSPIQMLFLIAWVAGGNQ